MKSKCVIKCDKIFEKYKNMKNFQKNTVDHENIRKFIKKSKNQKIKKSKNQ